jgi:nitrous oxidase accessory protein NosD
MSTIIRATLALVLLVASGARAARLVTVHPGESIQAALDAAAPGTTIVVLPGVYHESGPTRALTVTQNDIRLLARPRPGEPVVIEPSGGQTQGIWVSPADTLDPPDDERPPCGTNGTRIRGFTLQGFTVRGFPAFGVYLACVNRFRITRTTSTANGSYAIFPVVSQHGRMARNTGSGTRSDACLYVGEDDDVRVDHNLATDCQVGFEIENSRHIVMRKNVARNNTAGIIVDVIDQRLTTVCADNRVEANLFEANNRPSSALPGDDTSDLLPGIGVVIAGADRTTLSHNVIRGHVLAGLTLVDFCLDRADRCAMPGLPIDPRPDGNHVLGNTFAENQIDVVYLPNGGVGNCFARNWTPAAGGATLPACR